MRDQFATGSWTVIESPPAEDVEDLRRNLRAYNLTRIKGNTGVSLGLFLRDERGNLRAGVQGYLSGACLEINLLWVHEAWRGRHVGAQLLNLIEEAAIARGGLQAILDTFSFQAPSFYEKLGYETFGMIDGFFNGQKKYFMRKRLRL
jgi:GNAT superfamily N-acetyltransferase